MKTSLSNSAACTARLGRLFLALFILSLPAMAVAAKPVLEGMNLDEGVWEMVGVRLYNHNPVPLQDELMTFVVDNKAVLKGMQAEWDFAPFYQDYCDYHYVLKFYKDKKLMKTLQLNLQCNYVTEGLMSYTFDPNLLAKLKPHMRKLSWSKIKFTDLPRLRTVLGKLQQASDIYFYQDIRPFKYDGYFVAGLNDLPWNVNRDSVRTVVEKQIAKQVGGNNFMVVPSIFFLDDKFRLDLRFTVYCNKDLARSFTAQKLVITAGWRSHFGLADTGHDELWLMIVGANKERYARLVR